MAIVDYMTHSIETDRSLDDIPLGIQAFWVTWIVQAEVNNGGFNQFYCNTADRLSVDAIKAFRYFNANAHADLMQQANAKRANEGATPKSMQADATKQSFVDSYAHSSLSPFDTRFEELQDELTELRHQKIRSVPHEFCDD
ncbi:MAG: DMP19 family protein [Planctomycetaceae bacterium]|nr:DMP19 family protein [Planctomycetaceae bacterium]